MLHPHHKNLLTIKIASARYLLNPLRYVNIITYDMSSMDNIIIKFYYTIRICTFNIYWVY